MNPLLELGICTGVWAAVLAPVFAWDRRKRRPAPVPPPVHVHATARVTPPLAAAGSGAEPFAETIHIGERDR